MKVGELLSMTPAEVALKLRASLNAVSSQDVAARGKWMRARHAEGATTKQCWDENAPHSLFGPGILGGKM